MVQIPPRCPTDQSMLWKDTTRITPACPDNWHWHCSGCSRAFTPTAEDKERFRHGTRRGSTDPVW